MLAGGASSRFGSDKALAVLAGRTLLEHALATLSVCDAVAVAGRRHAGLAFIDDLPGPGLGPAGGLAGSLAHAAARGHAALLAVPVDHWPLPPDLLARLAPGPAVAADAPVIGLWPVGLAGGILAAVTGGERRMRALAALAGARTVALPPHRNINRAADFANAANLLQNVTPSR